MNKQQVREIADELRRLISENKKLAKDNMRLREALLAVRTRISEAWMMPPIMHRAAMTAIGMDAESAALGGEEKA